MARKRKSTQPASPLDIARRKAAERERAKDPGSWGINPEALDLAVNHRVTIRTGPAGRVARAKRQDVFDSFFARGSLSQNGHDAVRRLQDDMAVLHRTQSGCRDYSMRVDISRRPESFSEARQLAGIRIEAALSLAGAASARLITALCETDVVTGAAGDWRSVVQRETGERLPDAQGALLRMACENLAGAYVSLARGPKSRPV